MVSNAKAVCRQETGKRDVFGRKRHLIFEGNTPHRLMGGVGAFDEGAAEGEVAAGHGRGSLRSGDGGCQGEGAVSFQTTNSRFENADDGRQVCGMFTLS